MSEAGSRGDYLAHKGSKSRNVVEIMERQELQSSVSRIDHRLFGVIYDPGLRLPSLGVSSLENEKPAGNTQVVSLASNTLGGLFERRKGSLDEPLVPLLESLVPQDLLVLRIGGVGLASNEFTVPPKGLLSGDSHEK